MAAYAATKHPPAGLILESGFPDARSLFRAPSPMAFLALFSTYRFPAAEFLRSVKVPALVVHGDADSIVPYDRGRALYERIEGPKQFFTVAGRRPQRRGAAGRSLVLADDWDVHRTRSVEPGRPPIA